MQFIESKNNHFVPKIIQSGKTFYKTYFLSSTVGNFRIDSIVEQLNGSLSIKRYNENGKIHGQYVELIKGNPYHLLTVGTYNNGLKSGLWQEYNIDKRFYFSIHSLNSHIIDSLRKTGLLTSYGNYMPYNLSIASIDKNRIVVLETYTKILDVASKYLLPYLSEKYHFDYMATMTKHFRS